MCGDDGNHRCAGAVVAGETEEIALGRRIEEISAAAGMRPVADGAGIEGYAVVTMWIAVRVGRARRDQD